MNEVTFVGEKIEVYAQLDISGKATDVYWTRDPSRLFLTDNHDRNSPEVPHTQGRNPLFVHAVDPEQAFRIAMRDFNLITEDEKIVANLGIH